MNLPLHLGALGSLEAGLIALLIAMLAFAGWNAIGSRQQWPVGRIIALACLTGIVIGAGWDTWNLFYLGMVRLESPLYARLAIAGIHDVQNLGGRVLMEWVGALAGGATGWLLFSKKEGFESPAQSSENTSSEP
ncbi:hypothetical protein [Pseudoxanthomonas dokdonensis]|uniref:Membrane protein n=1 Tax=Pseudoxanthomonas dokdonensis TaxID=344882 RepID=A0A0R0CFM7_9GAMM|nr:hypothetical protein [Pseudoxanthomonas dokdonensis]KRG68588.1 membrane protein [Pseudoxanthomonas dokdonensis]